MKNNHCGKIKNLLPAMTLIEMIIAVSVMTMLFGVLTTCVIEIQGLSQTSDAMNLLQHEARVAIARISQDLRKAAPSKINIKPPNNDEIQYTKPKIANATPSITDFIMDWDPAAYRIRMDPSGTKGLISEQGGVDTVLAPHVQAIKFFNSTAYPLELKVVLNLTYTDNRQKTYNFTAISIINMRN